MATTTGGHDAGPADRVEGRCARGDRHRRPRARPRRECRSSHRRALPTSRCASRSPISYGLARRAKPLVGQLTGDATSRRIFLEQFRLQMAKRLRSCALQGVPSAAPRRSAPLSACRRVPRPPSPTAMQLQLRWAPPPPRTSPAANRVASTPLKVSPAPVVSRTSDRWCRDLTRRRVRLDDQHAVAALRHDDE